MDHSTDEKLDTKRLAESPIGATAESDRQRSALRDLISLSAEAAAVETEIEKTHRIQIQQAAKQLSAALEEIEQQTGQRELEVDAEYEHRISQLTQTSEKALVDLKAQDSIARQSLEYSNEATETDLKSKLQQAIWLAESVFEATQNQVAKEYKTARDDLEARDLEITELTNRAAALLMWYGQQELTSTPVIEHSAAVVEPLRSGTAESPEQSATAPNQKLAADKSKASYPSLRDEIVQRISDLETLTLPRLFVGIWPFLTAVVVCVVVCLVAQLIAGGIPNDLNAVEWKVVGYALVGSLVVCGIGGFLLRLLARVHVRNTYFPIKLALASAKAASQSMLDEARSQRDSKLGRAAKKRDLEIHGAKEKIAPYHSRAANIYESAATTAKADYARRSTRIQQTRQQEQSAADEWKDRTLAEIAETRKRDTQAARLAHDRAAVESHTQHAESLASLRNRWNSGLADIQRPLDQTAQSANGAPARTWNESEWRLWTPPSTFAREIPFGEFQVNLQEITDQYPRGLTLPPTFSVPASLAFPEQGSMLIHTDHAGRAEAIRVQQMLISRLLTRLPPGRVRFTIIDPVGLGQNFAGFMHLADHDEALVGTRIWTETEHIHQQLANLTEHMETVIQKYLRNEFETIDQYNAQAGELAEPYRYLVIADFPVGFEGDSFRRLNSIATSGARCGVFFIIVRDLRQPLPGGMHLDELQSHSINLVRKDNGFQWKDDIFKKFPLTVDPPPDEAVLTKILDTVGRGAKQAKRVEVPFESIVPRPSEIWSGDSKDELQVPVGRLGATRLQMLRLGRGVAQHALIAGKTGSGKSTLLHVLITNLSLWYSPDQVEFYLVDFKKGVEFKTYAEHQLPHARAIAVESDREFGLSVLQRIDAELARRGDLYRKLGVQDLASYRAAAKAAATNGDSAYPTLPRTLLIIDEFQEFFTEDDKLSQEASLLLDRLVRQGRAFGIHVLLGSQTIGGTSGLARTTIGQMGVRVALQTSEADSQLILGDANSAARLLSRPGEAIYNDAGGLVEGNSPFQISWLNDDQRENYLEEIHQRATAQSRSAEPIVFEGNAPADITRNHTLYRLLESPAGKPNQKRPPAPLVWLGDPVAIKEPIAIALRDQSGSNVLIIGQHEEPAMALIASSMISLSAQHTRESARFYLLDGTPADSTFAGLLPKIASQLQTNTENVEWRNIADALASIADEVAKRQGAENQDAPAIYIFIYGLQRYRMLRKSEESFSFSSDESEKRPQPDKLFSDILREGPAVGVHVLAWADTAASLERTLDRGSLREFDNRVLFQMSATDSSNLIDSPAANKLGYHRAMVYSEERGIMEKFRPYALPPKQWLEQLSHASSRPG